MWWSIALATPGLTLEATPLRSGVDPRDAPVTGKLFAGEQVKVLAQSSFRLPVDGDPVLNSTLGYKMVLIESSIGVGWVNGEHLGINDPVAWVGQHPSAFESDEYRVWPVGTVGREWSEGMEDWEFSQTEGWLVRSKGTVHERFQIVTGSGWGSESRVESIIHRDVTADQVSDRIFLIADSITEVGLDQHRLVFVDPESKTWEPVLEVELHDPTWTGLDTTDQWGWAAIDWNTSTMLAPYIERLQPDEKGVRRLQKVVRTWTWATASIAEQPVRTEPVRGTIQNGVAKQPVCIDAIDGAPGTGQEIRVRARHCEGKSLGWMSHDRIQFDDTAFQAAMGERPNGWSPLEMTWESP